MKAVLCTTYGSPDMLQLNEVAQPMPKDDEVLVRVRRYPLEQMAAAHRYADTGRKKGNVVQAIVPPNEL